MIITQNLKLNYFYHYLIVNNQKIILAPPFIDIFLFTINQFNHII
jgi:hypothetical protein